MRTLVAICLLLFAALPALAVQPDEVLPNPAQEARARALSRELRCMVCQNQSIDDSDAPLAHDLRVLVRERIVAGDSDKQVLDFLVARYGEFVLLKPRFEGHTLVLWLLPPTVLVLGGFGLLLATRRRAAADPADSVRGNAAPLNADESARLRELVEDRD